MVGAVPLGLGLGPQGSCSPALTQNRVFQLQPLLLGAQGSEPCSREITFRAPRGLETRPCAAGQPSAKLGEVSPQT